MADRSLGRLTVKHRGVPIGTIEIVEHDRDQPIEPLLPPELRERLDRSTSLWSRGFWPSGSFVAAVASLAPHLDERRAANDQWRSVLAEPPSDNNRALVNAAWARITHAEQQLGIQRGLIERIWSCGMRRATECRL
jgi:hypothetical protein